MFVGRGPYGKSQLYLPEAEMSRRPGAGSVVPLGQYVKLLAQETGKYFAGREAPKATGLLVAVGIKRGKQF